MYANPHAGLAHAHILLSVLGWEAPRAVMPIGKAAAMKALALDNTVSDGHLALGMALHFYDWDWAGAESAYRRAIALNPGNAEARSLYVMLLAARGRWEAARAEARLAVACDPLSLVASRACA